MAIQINGTSGISGVDGSAGTPALQGTDSNTGISFGTDTVNINTGGTTRATVDSSGRLLLGTSSARTDLGGLQPKLQVEGTSFVDGTISAVVNSITSSTAPSIVLAKSAGASIGSNTLVSSGDVLGRIRFQGNDGSNFDTAAWIQCDVDGTPGSDDMPGRLVFSTTADGASSPTEQMRLDSSGNLKYNSGYGSVATAYGCRAWVAFNGSGTISVFGNGNVSSITDVGTGEYTVNFSTAITDNNYSCNVTSGDTPTYNRIAMVANGTRATGSIKVVVVNMSFALVDGNDVNVSIHR